MEEQRPRLSDVLVELAERVLRMSTDLTGLKAAVAANTASVQAMEARVLAALAAPDTTAQLAVEALTGEVNASTAVVDSVAVAPVVGA